MFIIPKLFWHHFHEIFYIDRFIIIQHYEIKTVNLAILDIMIGVSSPNGIASESYRSVLY